MTGSVSERFDQACVAAETDPDAGPELLPMRLAHVCATVLGVDGAGLSLFDGDFRVPLGASSPMAGFAERLQFTQGEGPCLHAVAHAEHVSADMAVIKDRWPAFAAELADNTPYRAIMALPLRFSPTVSAALDLYFVNPEALAEVNREDAAAVGDAVRTAMVNAEPSDESVDGGKATSDGDGTAEETPDGPAWVHTPAAESRQLVWVAMGMVMTAEHLDADDALAVLRAHSYSHGRTVDATARGLVRGDISLSNVAVG